MNKYDDIINLPHHVSATRKPMTLYNRASQFAPFSALTGYDDKIKETARLTDKKIELDEDSKKLINKKISIIAINIKSKPLVNILYFVPDKKKSGGKYINLEAKVKKIDEYNKEIILLNNEAIKFNDIYQIDCKLLDNMDF